MSQIETQYDMFLTSMKDTVKNVDVNLMLKIMYLERKLPGVSPHVEIEIKLKPGINRAKKEMDIRTKYGYRAKKEMDIRTKYGFQSSSLGEHDLFAVGQMNMDLVAEIAKDSDIVSISGVATPASY